MDEMFELSANSLLNDILNLIILTLKYAECLYNVSMEMWGQAGGEGAIQDATKHVSAAR